MQDAGTASESVSGKTPPRRRSARSAATSLALLDAARAVFAEQGVHGSYEEIARRAGVGIGTLYRHFPDRGTLLEAVYFEEVETLARTAQKLDVPAEEALRVWLHQFLRYAITKRAVIEALNTDTPLFAACIRLIHEAGEPLLARAQASTAVRADIAFDDVRRLVTGVAAASPADEMTGDRLLDIVLDGLRPRP